MILMLCGVAVGTGREAKGVIDSASMAASRASCDV